MGNSQGTMVNALSGQLSQEFSATVRRAARGDATAKWKQGCSLTRGPKHLTKRFSTFACACVHYHALLVR